MYQHGQSSYELIDWSGMQMAKVGLHQGLWIYILTFSFVLLWDSWPCGWMGLWLFCHLLVFLAYIGLPCPAMMWLTAFVLSYNILFCYVWLFSLWNLFFSNEKQKGSGFRWEGKCGGTGRSNCNHDILCNKIIYFNKRKKDKNMC